MAINPFKSVLFITFVKERDLAIRIASGGGMSENEQLVWVLWKILKGDGNDVRGVLFFSDPNQTYCLFSRVRSVHILPVL
jgi:hypothetical protein